MVRDKTHVDVDFCQRDKADPYQFEFFAEVKDQFDGEWRPHIKLGEWSAVRQLAWSWSKAHPERPPALAMVVYVRKAPEPQIRLQAYYPDITEAERTDIFKGQFSELTEMDVERFCSWLESLPEEAWSGN
jgi:hypothetical protein